VSPAPAPRVILARPAPPVISRIGAPPAPRAVYVRTPGPIGAVGPIGQRGPVGYSKGFGTIDYTDNQEGTSFPLPSGQWVRLTRNLSPSSANFNLPSGPFADFAFWDNASSTLRARAKGDVLLFKFSYVVVPEQRGGGLRFSVRPGDDEAFEFGPDPIAMTADAGESQPGSETFVEQCRTRFVTSGASIYVMATSGATLFSFSPEVTPLDYAGPVATPPVITPPASATGVLDFGDAANSGLLGLLCPGLPNAITAPSAGVAGTVDFSNPANSGLLAALAAGSTQSAPATTPSTSVPVTPPVTASSDALDFTAPQNSGLLAAIGA